MRLPARRIATSALCAALLLGVTGPAAVAADDDPVRERTRAASQAPLPDADALLAQVAGLGELGGVLTPVAGLLTAVLKADDGRITPEAATELGSDVKDAIARATAAAPTTLPVTTTPAGTTPTTVTPAMPGLTAPVLPGLTVPGLTVPGITLPALPLIPDGSEVADVRAKAPADLVAEAMAALEKSTDALLQAVLSGDASKVDPAVDEVMNSVVDLVAATLFGSGLPAPTMNGLPPLPARPAEPATSGPAAPGPAAPPSS
ncbi:hypothetical protein ACIF8T_01130 [Streptomyces sp. NPDC085946]|uniref:hypothetical protein n=1 Tax=Streptomyces sp. NPDC085946 TaxID=3365744 RepID=UPI0037CDC3DF